MIFSQQHGSSSKNDKPADNKPVPKKIADSREEDENVTFDV
jgi:hypothetical protein